MSPRLVRLLALPCMLGLMGAACPRKPEDCEHDSLERCNWEEAVGSAASAGPDSKTGGDEFGSPAGGGTLEVEADDLDDTLADMVEIMGAGLEWSLTDARARDLCRVRNENGKLVRAPVIPVAEGDAAKAKAKLVTWRCHLEWLEISGVSLELEASEGVISLSAEDLDLDASEALASFARARFDDRCRDEFEEFEGAGLDEFQRCALPEGPYLVIARLAQNPEATRWQVSIAVVDAG